ncbi:MAG: hypothetical protein WBC22_15360 [Sedimentisphaerales bacterium]
MAVNTRLKRQSATCMLVPSMVSGVYPSTAGIVQAEKQAVSWVYSGILAVGEITVQIGAATMAYAGAALGVNAKTTIAIAQATMSYAGQALTVVEDTTIQITQATMAYLGRSLSVTGMDVVKRGLRALGNILTMR